MKICPKFLLAVFFKALATMACVNSPTFSTIGPALLRDLEQMTAVTATVELKTLIVALQNAEETSGTRLL